MQKQHLKHIQGITIIDISTARLITPGCNNVVHLNNAGAALMPAPVFDAVSGHLQKELELGGYEAAALADAAIADFYPAVATLLNAHSDEIAYIENATRAWDMAFYSIPFERGDRVITHRSEYASNYLAFLQMAASRGIEIDLAPSNKWGQIDVDALEHLITPRTRLIAITYVPSTSGVINPVAEVGQIASKHNVLYLLDACQSVGQMPVDVEAIGCDLLAATGRKFLRGPRGTGFLYASRRVIEQLQPPFIDLRAANWSATDHYQWHGDARRFENWERYVAGQIGLASAVRYATDIGLDVIRNRILELIDHLATKLRKIDQINVQEPIAENIQACAGIVTASVDHRGVEDIQLALREQGIHVTVVLERNAKLFLNNRERAEYIRVSPHYYNTINEIDIFCEAITNLV